MSIMTLITRTAIVSLIPKLISSIGDMFTSDHDQSNPRSSNALREQANVPRNSGALGVMKIPYVPIRKNDTTKFTQFHFDSIMNAYERNRANNLIARSHGDYHKVVTLYELTDVLNELLKLHKSRTSYSRIWDGKVLREHLASAPNIFTEV